MIKEARNNFGGKFYTENYARIQCSACGKDLIALQPGKGYADIPACDCTKPLPKKKPAAPKKKPAPIETGE